MGKRIVIGTVWKWIFKKIEQLNLTPSQQLALFHVTEMINKNFWKPTPISLSKLASSVGQDRRTVKKALDSIVSNGLIKETKVGYEIGFRVEDFEDTSIDGAGALENDGGGDSTRSEIAASTGSGDGVLRRFNETRLRAPQVSI